MESIKDMDSISKPNGVTCCVVETSPGKFEIATPGEVKRFSFNPDNKPRYEGRPYFFVFNNTAPTTRDTFYGSTRAVLTEITASAQGETPLTIDDVRARFVGNIEYTVQPTVKPDRATAYVRKCRNPNEVVPVTLPTRPGRDFSRLKNRAKEVTGLG